MQYLFQQLATKKTQNETLHKLTPTKKKIESNDLLCSRILEHVTDLGWFE